MKLFMEMTELMTVKHTPRQRREAARLKLTGELLRDSCLNNTYKHKDFNDIRAAPASSYVGGSRGTLDSCMLRRIAD